MHYLFILSGPGGCGKDTIIDHVLQNRDLKLKKLINYTSRAKRSGEYEGKDYYFLTKVHFERKIEHGQMLEYEVMATNHHYYGTAKDQLLHELQESHVICKKMPAGALALKKYFGEGAVTIFVDANDSELESRLLETNRSLEHSTVRRRLKQANRERRVISQFDHSITNHDGDLKNAVTAVERIIAEKIST